MTQLIDLGKLRFHFAGAWLNTTVYESNDIVRYGGNVYVYTYALKVAGILPTDTSHWALMVEGFKFQGVFNNATAYKIGDGIAYGGKVYVSILDSTGQIPPNTTYWSQFVDGIQYEGEYSPSTPYQKNDVVIYGGSTYIAKVDTTAHDPSNTTYWDKFIEGISPSGVYNSGTAYVSNDLVAYGPNLYRAKSNTIGNLPSNSTYWELYVSGTIFQGAYSSATTYYLNDIVSSSSNLYRSKLTQANVLPAAGSNWELLLSGISFQNAYNGATTYYLNDIVSYGANTYRSKVTQSANLPTDSINWELLTAGFSYQDVWSSSTGYLIGQVIKYGGSLFQALSDNTNVNPTTTATWAKIVSGYNNKGSWVTATQYGIDEVVAYGGNTYITLLPHASTVFATDLAASKWQKFNSGIRYRGVWLVGDTYLPDDIVISGSSTYIANALVTGGATPLLGTNASFTMLAAGAEGLVAKTGDFMTGDLLINPGEVLVGQNTSALRDNSAGYVGLTNTASIFSKTANDFVQLALKNTSAGISASTDLIAYASDGDNDSGWIDLGITSETYSDPTFSVTGPGTGYLFMSAPAGTPGTGDLLIGTDLTGSHNDIAFFTNGFAAGNERMRIIGQSRAGETAGVEIYIDTTSNSTSTGALRVHGGMGLLGNLNVGGNVDIQGTISIGGAGSALATTALAVSDPTIRMGTGNPSDAIDLGIIAEHGISTTLSGNLTINATTISVVSTVGFPTSGVLSLTTDSEQISYTGVTPTSFTGCTRGFNNTIAATHTTGTNIRFTLYTGLVRDASDGIFKLFDSSQVIGSTTVDFSGTGLVYAPLKVSAITADTGATINKFSIDASLVGNSDTSVPTEKAVKTYVDSQVPQAIPTAVGQTGNVLTSDGTTVIYAAPAIPTSLPFVTSISTDTSLTANTITFGMSTLTVTATLTIPTGAYLSVLNPDGFALFN